MNIASVLIPFLVSTPASQPWRSPGNVVIRAESPQNGRRVNVNSTVQWAIAVEVASPGQGLAAFSVDVRQSPANPGPLSLSPAAVPGDMATFDRPLGVCNPGVPGSTGVTGYGGTLLPPFAGAPWTDLVQIGGAQNTFGVAGSLIATNVVVTAGVGQSVGGQVVATGEFPAPATPGVYVLLLTNPIANLLTSIGVPPAVSPTISVVPEVAGSIAVIVACIADFNGIDGVSLDDLFNFLAAYFAGDPSADVNGIDGVTLQDLFDFLAAYFAGCA